MANSSPQYRQNIRIIPILDKSSGLFVKVVSKPPRVGRASLAPRIPIEIKSQYNLKDNFTKHFYQFLIL